MAASMTITMSFMKEAAGDAVQRFATVSTCAICRRSLREPVSLLRAAAAQAPVKRLPDARSS